MEEQLVSYETAKILKELNFDKYCSHYYILNFQNFRADGILYKHGLPDNCDSSNIFQYVKNTKQPHIANAPTQSLLQKWLREVHSIEIIVFPIKNKEEELLYASEILLMYVNNRSSLKELFKADFWHYYTLNSYEAALDYALQVALRMLLKE